MLVIGLTGGIGSGKSTVADLFAQHGIAIIDTDQIARDVVEPDSPALQKLTQHFGQVILNNDGSLNRSELRDIVFANPDERKWLEQTLHPLIRIEMQKQIQQAKPPYCVAVIPLLVENLPNKSIDRILVIDSTKEQQIARTKARDKLNDAQIENILHSQATREERLKVADDIIYNDKDLVHLTQQVETLHQQYLTLGAKPRS